MQEDKMWEYLNQHIVLKDMLTMEYIHNLIYGELSSMGTMSEITKILDLRKIPNTVFILMVDDFWDICLNYDNKKRYAIKRRVLNYVKKAIEDYDAIACSLIGTDKIIILMDTRDYSSKNIVKEAKHITEYIKSNTNYTATIGIGSIRKDYRDIWRAYEEAFLAINYSFSLGKDLIIQYKDIKKPNEDKILDYDYFHYEYQLFKNLLKVDTNIVLVLYDNLFNSLINNGYKIENIKSIMNKFVLDLSDYSRNLGLNSNLISEITMETSAKIITSSSVTTISEIGKEYLEAISNQIIDYTNNMRSSLDAAILFINKYYYNEISLKDISHIVNMSPSYFSRNFKEHCGINFSNYVLGVRLKKSQELLLKTSLSIVDIAEKVGFNNSTYFSKRFKDMFNHSPSYYRKKMQSKK